MSLVYTGFITAVKECRRFSAGKMLLTVTGIGMMHLLIASHIHAYEPVTGSQAFQGDVFAATAELFEVRGLTIDVTARSAALARNTGFQQVQRRAFFILMEKLTEARDRESIPETPIDQIIQLVSGIDVVSESFSSRRYVAEFNIRFSPQFFSEYLARYDVPHVLSAGPDIAVIDRYTVGDVSTIWAEDSMTKARELLQLNNRIRRYSFTEPTLRNRLNISVTSLKDKADIKAALGALYQKKAFLFLDVLKAEDSRLLYRTYLSDTDAETYGIYVPDQTLDDRTNIAGLYQQVFDKVDSEWRRTLLVNTSEGGAITMKIEAHNAATFSEVLKRLQSVSLVSSFSIKTVSIPESAVEIAYRGRVGQLILALGYSGLTIIQRANGYLLSTSDDASSSVETEGSS